MSRCTIIMSDNIHIQLLHLLTIQDIIVKIETRHIQLLHFWPHCPSQHIVPYCPIKSTLRVQEHTSKLKFSVIPLQSPDSLVCQTAFSFHSYWRRLLAPAEPRRVPGNRQCRRLLPLHPYLPRHVRPLPHHLRLPPDQDAQAEAEGNPGQGGQDPQGPAAQAAPATSAQAASQYQSYQPETRRGRKEGKKDVMKRMVVVIRDALKLVLDIRPIPDYNMVLGIG